MVNREILILYTNSLEIITAENVIKKDLFQKQLFLLSSSLVNISFNLTEQQVLDIALGKNPYASKKRIKLGRILFLTVTTRAINIITLHDKKL